MRTNPRIGLVLAILLATVLAACSNTGATASPSTVTEPPAASPSDPPAATASPTSTAETPTEPPPSAGAETVAIADSSLGQILVDGEGRTLYLFRNDTAGESVCYDECEANWPPLLATDEITVGAGLDDSDFSTVARTDGSMQVKVGEWPLYYFTPDAAPGDTNGQGVGEVWYVVSPAGEAIE